MTEDLMTAFDDSLNALATGESVGAVLARYPHLGDDLRPMLEAVQAARQYGMAAPAPPAAQNRNRARFLARAAALRGQRRPAAGWLSLGGLRPWVFAHRVLAASLAVALGLTLGAAGVLNASAASLPGQPLYALKRTVEQTQLLLAFDGATREELAADFSERRVNEVRDLLADAQAVNVAFGGLLERVVGERWTVAGIAVIVPDGTEVMGIPFPGLYVEIQGSSQTGGAVIATRVEVTGLAFIGTLRARSAATWQVDDVTLFINDDTTFTGAPQPGDQVTVMARRQLDGAWLALHIGLRTAGPEGLPVTAPTPTATPPRANTPAPSPSATAPAPTGTAIQTGPTPTQDDDDHGETESPEPTHTPSGGGGPGPSASNTPEPAETDEPDETESPEETDEPDGDEGGGDSQEQRWQGTLEAVNGGMWIIGGQAVTVNGGTEIRDNPQVGNQVEVRAVQQGDGSWTALRIEKKD